MRTSLTGRQKFLPVSREHTAQTGLGELAVVPTLFFHRFHQGNPYSIEYSKNIVKYYFKDVLKNSVTRPAIPPTQYNMTEFIYEAIRILIINCYFYKI